MTDAERLLAGQKEMMERFTRKEYPVVFRQYAGKLTSLFSCLDADGTDALMDELFITIERRKPRRLRQGVYFFDMQRFLLLYLIPGAAECGIENARSFSVSLRERWNRTYPKYAMKEGSYSDIVSGFSTKIAGISFGRFFTGKNHG